MPNDSDEVKGWFTGRLPEEWSPNDAQVLTDREEIVVIVPVEAPEFESGSDQEAVTAAIEGRVKRFREDTRDRRMEIAEEAQRRFKRHVSWGVTVGEQRYLFTHLSVPSMTRLRITERQVLDTLVDAGVARSRSEALQWCVRLVAKNEDKWLKDLREAFEQVEKVRAGGPASEMV